MKTRWICMVVAALASSLALAAPASAQFMEKGAIWVKTAPPPGATNGSSIKLSSPASVAFKGFGATPPAASPSYDFQSPSVSGPSGGSPRLIMTFSDGGDGQLRPLNLVAGQWTHEDGSSDWDSRGGTCGDRYQQSYASLVACHAGAQVRRVEIRNDSGWLYSGGLTVFVDNVTYGKETVSRPLTKRERKRRKAIGVLEGPVKPPVLGRRVLVKPSPSSDVKVCPVPPCSGGMDVLVPLDKKNDVPVGSVIDTRRGAVTLSSVKDKSGGLQSGSVSDGLVEVVSQSRGGPTLGLTELKLTGGDFQSCSAGKARGGASQAHGARGPQAQRASRGHSTKRVRKAHTSGYFKATGRHGSGTANRRAHSGKASSVTDTTWDTIDRCDGTLFVVSRGSVTVSDFGRQSSIEVGPGEPYLAKAP